MCLKFEVNLTLPFGQDCRAGQGQMSNASAAPISGTPPHTAGVLVRKPGCEGGTAAGWTGLLAQSRAEQSRAGATINH